MRWIPVASSAAIPPGTAISVSVDEDPVLVGRTSSGVLFAFDDRCTHDGGRFGGASLAGDTVACPRHGARFDVTTGAVLRMPAVVPLHPRVIRIRNDGWIEVAEEADG